MGLHRHIFFVFDEAKATEAACHILQRLNGRRDYFSLIKLLYLAERQSLIENRWPIFGDAYASLDHGPIVSTVYNIIKDDRDWLARKPRIWPAYIERIGQWDVLLKQPVVLQKLSPNDVAILDAVVAEHGRKDWRELRRFTHSLPEYQDPQGSSIPILPDEILSIAGASEEEIKDIRLDADAFRHMFAAAS